MTLSGTNVFVIGEGPLRVMIDTADLPEYNVKFLENLRILMADQNCNIDVSNFI